MECTTPVTFPKNFVTQGQEYSMKQAISLGLALMLTGHLIPNAWGEDTMVGAINATPVGTKIEIRLKDKEKLRGERGVVSDAGFTLVDAHQGDRQSAFDDVASFKRITGQSHTVRNVAIIAGIGVAALGITAAILLRCGPLGCRSRL
jgi:hypothetical protein